ncbi:MAG: pantetheine-phosphate adenylyltransferase [Candidatus Bathyarchaeota archaeon]|nr:pantetheine-phosphate adenylyltransferase [Candidatus Termiticorpusculum sp.]MCL1970326.1 pantetheine-phosphate adenylyltransferase [Candidatus Termiticorpusculum sp.]
MEIKKKQFNTVAVGGTFDELHKGHKMLLKKAFQVGEHVIVGLSSDEFVAKMNKPHKTASYNERLEALTCFLEKAGYKNRFQISPLHDSYGLTLNKDKNIDALIVSQETVKICEIINKKRVETALPPLSIIQISLVPAENKKPISTTLIHANEIDKNGKIVKKNVFPAKSAS